MGGLRVDGVRKTYGEIVALDGVSLDVADGELLVLLGPSGCGKSTLLRVIAGLVEPDEGRVLIDGDDVSERSPAARDVAMVFQSYALYPHLTVARNLGFGLRARRTPRSEVARRVGEVAAQLGLEHLLDRRPRELSGGQRQRVALGRAMVREPKAFLMDEPLSNLDAQMRSSTRDEIADLHRRLGATFVYVTHDQVEAMTIGSQIVVMNHGRIEQVGTPAEVYDEPATTFVSQFVGSPPMNLVEAEVGSNAGTVRALAPGLDLRLWPGEMPPRRLLVGIRPEHLVPVAGVEAATTPTTGGRVEVRVTVVENLGNEEIARCELGGTAIQVRGPRPLALRAGEPVALRVATGRVSFFDPGSGRRLVWVDERHPASSADGRREPSLRS